MCTTPAFSEKCYYSYLPFKSYYDVNGYTNSRCQYTYECIYAIDCYECTYTIYSSDCRNSHFLLDCRNCQYCFACVNIHHKKYCFFNEQLNKKAYIQRIQEYFEKYSRAELSEQLIAFSMKFPRRATR